MTASAIDYNYNERNEDGLKKELYAMIDLHFNPLELKKYLRLNCHQ